MATEIHPSAVVDGKAKLGADVVIGPFCLIGPDVEIGDGCRLHSHVVVTGRTRLGSGNIISPNAVIGGNPQDLKYHGEPSLLQVGNHNVIRENVTMNIGTESGGMITRVGDHCLFMAGTHVAHDCQVGNHCIMANNAVVAGHVVVEDYAILGGLSAVHQFCRIGRYAMVGGMTGVDADVIPYGTVTGNRAQLAGLNLIGMQRHNIAKDEINGLRHAFKDLFAAEGTLEQRREQVAEKYGQYAVVAEVIAFLRADSSRRFCVPHKGN